MSGADGPPAFDAAFDGDVEQRVYAAILQAREPTSASKIAETADCDPKTARKYLSWFVELGVVTEHEGRPVTYQRNDAYFKWRRANELASTHSLDELQRRVVELTEEIEAYREQYDAESPAEVDVLALDPDDVDEAYADLADWASAERDRRLFERARRQVAESSARSHG